MKRPNTKGWELAARKYCESIGIDPDAIVHDQKFVAGCDTLNLVNQWMIIADELYLHQQRNHAIGVFNNSTPDVIHS